MLPRPAQFTLVVNMRKEPSRACYANLVHSGVTAIASPNNARLRPLPAITAHVTTLDIVRAVSRKWKGEQGTNEIHNMLAEQRTRQLVAA